MEFTVESRTSGYQVVYINRSFTSLPKFDATWSAALTCFGARDVELAVNDGKGLSCY